MNDATAKRIHNVTCYGSIIIMIIVIIVVASTFVWNIKQPTIAIVGSGPAGILMALELCDRGYRKIEVYGRLDDSQVQSVKFDGVNINIGAVGATSRAHTAPNLLSVANRFGMKPSNVIYQNDVTYSRPEDVKSIATLGELPYETIKNSWSKSISAWANSNGVSPDILRTPGLLNYSLTGYGPVTQIPLYHSVTGLVNALSNDNVMYILDVYKLMNGIKGYLSAKGVKFYNTNAANVEKKKITLVGGAVKQFDIIIISCDPSKINHPLSHILEGAIEHTNYFSAVFTVTGGPPPMTDIMIYNDVISENTKNKTVGYIVRHVPGSNIYHIVAYGYHGPDTNDELILGNVMDQLNATLPDNTIVAQKIYRWDHNLRYTKSAIQLDIPKMVGLEQGKDNIWYNSGLFSHWDISNIGEFNHILVEYILRSSMKRPVPTGKID